MMNGYSKIGSTTATSTHKSTRSIDFFSFPPPPPPPQAQTPKPITHLPPTTLDQAAVKPNIINNNDNEEESPQTQREDHHENGGKGERFGVILGRSCSVSNSSSFSSSSASGFQATMKRAFSVRRSSSSVTDRYCRIHDQSMAIASDELDDEDDDDINMNDATNNKTNRGRRGKILKACKRLFGL